MSASSHWVRFAALAVLVVAATDTLAGSILFIGNSVTHAHGSPVHFYRSDTVTDLNGQGIGGMPALFKSFTLQAGLDYDVYLETQGGVGLDWHLDNKSAVIGQRPWDSVVMHGFSTLDARKPGDPALLIDTVGRMAALLRSRNPAVEIRVMATWPRADQTYEPKGAWYGKPIEAMAHDVRAGVADPNPYDGIEAGKIDLWTFDHYHASTFGYYLEALVVFGSVTGLDPRSLGENECSGYELGLSQAQIAQLEQVAFDQLAETAAVKPASRRGDQGAPSRCLSPH